MIEQKFEYFTNFKAMEFRREEMAKDGWYVKQFTEFSDQYYTVLFESEIPFTDWDSLGERSQQIMKLREDIIGLGRKHGIP
jgi:hypothetical protein